jgi:uncharacterized protein (DUF1499 family)
LLYVVRIVAAGFIAMSLFSCSGTRPANLGIKDGRLAPCPSTPNCVSSDAADDAHAVPQFQLVVPPDEGWRAVRTAIEGLPRTKIVSSTDDYLHAECSRAVFGFVDDLELHLRPAEKLIAVRSAARLGYSDLGVNRKRVESLREVLRERGVIR